MNENLTAAQTEDRRKALIELRDTLAAVIDGGSEFAKINGSFAYRQCLADIAEIDTAAADKDAAAKGLVDEVKARRDAKTGRRSAAHASSNP